MGRTRKNGIIGEDRTRVFLKSEDPEIFDNSEEARYDIVLLPEENGVIPGIKIILKRPDDPLTDDDDSDLEIEDTESTETEKQNLSEDDCLKFLAGWWESEEDSKKIDFLTWFDSLRSDEISVDYSVDSDTNRFKVSITSNSDKVTIENNYGFIFEFIDEDHVSVTETGETQKSTVIYERCDAPE